jgi:hypothetical protein
MTQLAAADALDLFQAVERALGDRDALAGLRRRIRTSDMLSGPERRSLLEQARFRPGCKPGPVELLPAITQG